MTGCNSEALFYGIGRKPDPTLARLCAYVEQSHETDASLAGLSGSHLLMVIYANGVGASRNIPYATHLACVASFAGMERDLRVAHLERRRTTWYRNDFRFCDDATSGLTGGWCAAHDHRHKEIGEAGAISAYADLLPVDERPAFMMLSRAQAAWGNVRGRNEVDLTGTLRTVFEIGEEDMQERDFIAMLTRLQTGRPPRLGPADLAAAQTKMQFLVDHLTRERGFLNAGTVTREGVSEAQSVWEQYRDAWGAFAEQAYPAWGSAGAQAWVTMKRTDMLAHLHAP